MLVRIERLWYFLATWLYFWLAASNLLHRDNHQSVISKTAPGNCSHDTPASSEFINYTHSFIPAEILNLSSSENISDLLLHLFSEFFEHPIVKCLSRSEFLKVASSMTQLKTWLFSKWPLALSALYKNGWDHRTYSLLYLSENRKSLSRFLLWIKI